MKFDMMTASIIAAGIPSWPTTDGSVSQPCGTSADESITAKTITVTTVAPVA